MAGTYNTSLNQIPAIVKKYRDELTGSILNYGCGRGWRKVEHYLFQAGTHIFPYDKYGDHYLRIPKVGNFDSIICANVLNVCDDDLLKETLANLQDIMSFNMHCTLYLSVYEGDRTGKGRVTKKGYQRNQKAAEYETLLNSYFRSVERKGRNFICSDIHDFACNEPNDIYTTAQGEIHK